MTENHTQSHQSPQIPKASRSVMPEIDAKHEKFRRYTLIGTNDKEIVRTAGELLEGSNLLESRDLVVSNLVAVFNKIREWCDQHTASLSAALIVVRPRKVSLFFVSNAARYDLILDSEMTKLEVSLSGSGGVGSVESFQIPERSVEQFVSDSAVLLWQKK